MLASRTAQAELSAARARRRDRSAGIAGLTARARNSSRPPREPTIEDR